MESRIQESIVTIDTYNVPKEYLKSFELFEEFSGKRISETIRARRKCFSKFGPKAKDELEPKVRNELETFYNWLQEVKGYQSDIAYYYSKGLKSLLLGLPTGVEVGLLFSIVLDAHAKKL